MSNSNSLFEVPESLLMGEVLRRRLTRLSYFAFAMYVARLLHQMGYTDIPLPARRSFKGPNATGGADLIARRDDDLATHPVYIQLKRYRGPHEVALLAVDQVRGTMMRDGVPEGLCFTTFRYSTRAKRAAAGYPGRPVRIVDGDELAQLALECRIGVLEHKESAVGENWLELDERWFKELEAYCDALRTSTRPNRTAHD